MRMNEYLDKYKVDVPPGTSGDWEVKRFTVNAEQAKLEALRAACNPQRADRSVPEGTYTQLLHGGTVVMSDTPAEIREHNDLFYRAKGKVLITGLGLGVALNGVMMHPIVEHVTVIEQSQDVINLTGHHWKRRFGDRLQIIHDNALIWYPAANVGFDTIWHDIWDSICTDNLEQMKFLHRRFGRRCYGWQGSWSRAYLDR